MNINIVYNINLPAGTYRIICTVCQHIYCDITKGDRTAAALKAMSIFRNSNVCKYCGGQVVIELNDEMPHLKYDAEHPYGIS